MTSPGGELGSSRAQHFAPVDAASARHPSRRDRSGARRQLGSGEAAAGADDRRGGRKRPARGRRRTRPASWCRAFRWTSARRRSSRLGEIVDRHATRRSRRPDRARGGPAWRASAAAGRPRARRRSRTPPRSARGSPSIGPDRGGIDRDLGEGPALVAGRGGVGADHRDRPDRAGRERQQVALVAQQDEPGGGGLVSSACAAGRHRRRPCGR